MIMRRIGVLTTGRQDWGILRSTARMLRDDPAFDLVLLAGGMHASAHFGRTVREVEADGFRPAALMGWIDDRGEPGPLGQTSSAVNMVGEALERLRPDAMLLVGDRFETAAGALAATLARVPLIHLHGGEETEGAIDNALRHAITKLSHFHLVSHVLHRERVISMGEDPACVHVVGAPGLDNLHRSDLASREEIEQFLGLNLRPPVVLVTVHPTTLAADPAADARALCAAMDRVDATYVITQPNADPGNGAVLAEIAKAAEKPRRVAVAALGERRYWGLMRFADAMAGNSSSAVIEAPVLGLPAVNIGDRQRGRLRGENLVDAAPEAGAVEAALRLALSAEFREQARRAPSPFGDGRSSERIREALASWNPDKPLSKRHGVPRQSEHMRG